VKKNYFILSSYSLEKLTSTAIAYDVDMGGIVSYWCHVETYIKWGNNTVNFKICLLRNGRHLVEIIYKN